MQGYTMRSLNKVNKSSTHLEENPGKMTHFGFEEISWQDKQARVTQVFNSVAKRYDLMNDIMSIGIHRLWKHFMILKSNIKEGQRVLDLASGTGDIAYRFAKKVGKNGLVVLSDINASMLRLGCKKLTDKGYFSNVKYVQANAESLPFRKSYFDCVSISFGLRNITDKPRAMKSMLEVLKPGGKVLVLEFSKPLLPVLSQAYDSYSLKILPILGKLIVQDSASYRYLAESIRKHPDQETLKSIILQVGFDKVEYHNLTGGIVTLHIGYKY